MTMRLEESVDQGSGELAKKQYFDERKGI